MNVEKRNGRREPLDVGKIHSAVTWACEGLEVSLSEIETGAKIQFFNGIKTEQIQKALMNSAASLVDKDKMDYEFAAARLLLQQIYKEVTGGSIIYPPMLDYVMRALKESRLSEEMLASFDFNEIDAAIDQSRDLKFKYQGLQTVYDRYLIRAEPKNGQVLGELIELPQHFWMRVAMGIALNEVMTDRTRWAIEFYNLLSTFKFVNSTPTLFNAGTQHSQLSSCYVVTVDDSIWEPDPEASVLGKGIFSANTECALYSKFAGGVGSDWTRVRPTGGHIKSTNGVSSGIIPYLKGFNDTSVAVNQGGKRSGSFAVYLEPWHGDIERFLDLKKPNGDERLRARELFPALWVNDLFIERVRDRKKWSLFCSHKNADLHELYCDDFKIAYEAAEARGDAIRQVDAFELWKKIITALVESGAPWITFKDEMNRRNPQNHDGVIHSSNLCTEIALNNNDAESAVCNLGSVNMAEVSPEDFGKVIPVAMRMLDNVIDLNFYPTDKARRSNLRHRPVGLGLMGWTDYIVGRGIDWESIEHLQVTDAVFERFSYWAIRGSIMLAQERGRYQSYEGSKWSKGILPIDTARELPDAWYSTDNVVDWAQLRAALKTYGMRNSNCTAIAPTATIANIVGTTPCIEPTYKQVFTKENKSGKFKIVDPSMRHGRHDLCKVAFNINQEWVIKAAAVRQKWLCQSQSVNLFKHANAKGNEISGWYFLAWELGLKATYYLKNQISQLTAEESGVEINTSVIEKYATEEALICSIDNGPNCESCQ
ncbi:MAG: ribonucleoside-diphosphate reductase subunit alpha [Methylobacter sp.]